MPKETTCKANIKGGIDAIYLINTKDIKYMANGELKIKRKYGKNKRTIFKLKP